MRQQRDPILISNRDYCLLDLAYQISVLLGTSGSIEKAFLFQIFAEHVPSNKVHRVLTNLQNLGFIKQAPSDKQVWISNPKDVFCQRFGDDVLFFNRDTAKILNKHWESQQFPLFAGDFVDEEDGDDEFEPEPEPKPDPDPEIDPEKQTKPSRRERDLALLETFDGPQMMADHLVIQEHLNETCLITYHSIRPFYKHCPAGLEPHTARAVLVRLGYMFIRIPLGHTQNHWGVSDQGLDLVDQAGADPSAHPDDLLKY